MADEAKKVGYSIETYQREDGWWSFRVNGQESRYRSSSPEGVQRIIDQLMKGPEPGAVRLKPVKAEAQALPPLDDAKRSQLKEKGLTDEQIDAARGVLLVSDPVPTDHWSLKPTVEARIAAMLAR